MNKLLTDNQKEAINKNGLFVVNACPGSGKTLTVAARLAKRLSHWDNINQGIATISFTNVAWQEIEESLSKDFTVKTQISYPHFLGTIDSFINQHIFLPFAHLVMYCEKRPELVGPPYNSWEPIGSGWYWPKEQSNCYKNNCKLNSFSYDVSGNVYNFEPINHFNNCNTPDKPCIRFKKLFNKKGYATQSDANYFAMKILQDYPQIAKALSYRFHVFMIDEAQDTSEIQMKIIELLIDNGLKEVMLIGDPYQAIYEWRNADPRLFIEKYEKWKDNSITLNENWRSSQLICDFFSNISSSSEPIIAKNEDVNQFHILPEIWGYKEEEINKIIPRFTEFCFNKGMLLNDDNNSAILVRANNTFKKIMGIFQHTKSLNPWNDNFTKELLESKYLFDSGDFKQAFKIIEKAFCKKINNSKICTPDQLKETVSKIGFSTWRKEIYKLLLKLPKANGKIKDWVNSVNKSLKENIFDISIKLKIKSDRGQNKYSLVTFEEMFQLHKITYMNKDYRVCTVHAVKGETLEAVLLLLKKKAGNNQSYVNVLHDDITNNEELRIVYVAITRPRKILVIAVPEKDETIWKEKFH